MKKISLIFFFVISWISIPAISSGADTPVFRIGGLVQSPLHLADLQQFRMENISARIIGEPKARAAARFRSVPLKSLLELAKVQGPIQELAVTAKNGRGEQIVLSAGEVLQETGSKYFVANSVAAGANKPSESLPALIAKDTQGAYVALRQLTFIEIVSVMQTNSAGTRKVEISKSLKAGLGIGNRLQAILTQAALRPEPTDILKANTQEGNAAAISVEELKSGPSPLIVPRKEGSLYDIVFPENSRRARLEKIVSIEIVSLKQQPMLYVVGVGCGDVKLLTSEAISIMAKADVIVSKEDYRNSLAGYIGGKPVLFDPFMNLARYQKSTNPEITYAEAEKRADAMYAQNMQKLKSALKEGMIVALLEPGDPTLYGGWRNWLNIPQDQIRITAGMSSFSVANTVLGEHDISKNPIIIAEPEQLSANELLIQSAAEKGNVLVLFMGLSRIKNLVPLFGKYFPAETPIIIVYNAGIAGKERRLETTLSRVIDATNAEKENFLGLVYVGRSLRIP